MNTNERLFLDLHVLQSVPPSCINRDDTGSPKTAVYGGVVRARVSSQSWKRAMRLMFRENLPKEKIGVRTLRVFEMVADQIRQIGTEGDPDNMAKQILHNAGLKLKPKDNKTDALFFISVSQARALAQLAVDNPDTFTEKPSKEITSLLKKTLTEQPGIDVALFGRMVASDPSMNTDACAQVAHSISTHRVQNEYDYFTAVDDLAPEDTAGAGHIGTVEFNSATMYRYATVAIHELYRYLGEDTIESIHEFVRAFVYSMPTGKQNTFGNRTLPNTVLITVRTDQPVNLVGAFERPVSSNDEGYLAPSSRRLVRHAQTIYSDFLPEPLFTFVTGDLISDLGTPMRFSVLLESLTSAVRNSLEAMQ